MLEREAAVKKAENLKNKSKDLRDEINNQVMPALDTEITKVSNISI